MASVLTRHLLVVGTGRSGTGYMAAVLTAAGLACGHEAIHTPEAALAGELPDWELPAGSSWLAVPQLAAERQRGTSVVLVVRHPLAVARSLVGLGLLREPRNVYAEVIAQHHPQTWAWRSEPNRALAHWCAWNAEAVAQADMVVRLEGLEVDQLRAMAALVEAELPDAEEALASVEHDVNHKREAKRPVPARLVYNPGLRRRALALYEAWT